MSDPFKNKFSSNFIFDHLIKKKIFEIENFTQLNCKTENRRQYDDVIKTQQPILKSLYNLFYFREIGCDKKNYSGK
jgi:hypothetical protein